MTKPILKVDIVCVEGDAHAVRSALEDWGAQVTVHWIGMAQDLVRVLGGEEPLSKHIILECHGHDGGMALPDLDESIEREQPYHRVLTARDLGEFLKLPDCVVLNTGCALGTAEFAEAFLDAGCGAYIGVSDYAEASAALFYVLHFFYDLLRRKASVREAHEAARAHDEETGMFVLYDRGPLGNGQRRNTSAE